MNRSTRKIANRASSFITVFMVTNCGLWLMPVPFMAPPRDVQAPYRD
jgi:hypothetical protein